MMRSEQWTRFQTDVYIVGCGPSMATFDWEVLRPFCTIAVNGAIQNVPEPTMFLTACSAFATRAHRSSFWNMDERIRRVLIIGKEHRYYHKVQPFLNEFHEVRAPSRFDGEIGFTWDTFATGHNSGFSAMQYAVLQGAKTIHLVGFDMGGSGHYYDKGGSSSTVIDQFYKYFVRGVKILQSKGIEVVSHTPSRLNGLIPYKELNDETTTGHCQSLHGQDGIRAGGQEPPSLPG